MTVNTPGKRWGMVVVALLAVYVFWGGTYLAMRFAVETIPPLSMAGVRFLLAGALLYAYTRRTGTAAPERSHWLGAGAVGVLLLAGGNGGVVLSAKMVPSGLSALLVATSPLWMVILNWLWLKDSRPGLTVWGGIAFGLVGIGLLAGGDSALLGKSAVDPFWAGVLTAAAFCWALGSIYSRKASLPDSAAMATAIEMLVGGSTLVLLGLICGEWSEINISAITAKSFLSFLYLVIFGSLVGFNAYVWLLQNASPVLVSTYAYVNPAVAVLMGVWLGGEALGERTVISTMVIVVSVMMITFGQLRSRRKPQAEQEKTCPRDGCPNE